MSADKDAWAEWDAAVAAGNLPRDLALALPDARLHALLRTPLDARKDERTVLRAEALRRETDRRQAANADLPLLRESAASRAVANRGAERVHERERLFEARGAKQLTRTAHETSLLAEQHRALVEDSIEQRAALHDAERRALHRLKRAKEE